jgi:hypothetical protein
MQVVYEYSKSNCVVELRVPCLSTDHRTRPSTAGPLNTGTDEGQWAVGDGRSLLRNATFQGLVQGVRYRFDSALQFQDNLAANVELIRSVPPAVPPPANLQLDAALRNAWSLTNWSAYVDAVWPQLQVGRLCLARCSSFERTPTNFPVVLLESPQQAPSSPSSLIQCDFAHSHARKQRARGVHVGRGGSELVSHLTHSLRTKSRSLLVWGADGRMGVYVDMHPSADGQLLAAVRPVLAGAGGAAGGGERGARRCARGTVRTQRHRATHARRLRLP